MSLRIVAIRSCRFGLKTFDIRSGLQRGLLMFDSSKAPGRPVNYDARQYLTRAGEEYGHCFVLLDGLLSRERHLENGQRQIVGLHVPGDVCGLAALADGVADCDVIALSPISCLPISRHWLICNARTSDDLTKALWQEMSREMAIYAAWVVNLGRRSAYGRLVHFMCELEARLLAAGHEKHARFAWPGTQADLGAAMGLSLVHINKTLRLLEADKVVCCGRNLSFRGITALSVSADFDPTYLALERETLGEMLLSRISESDNSQNNLPNRLYEKSLTAPTPTHVPTTS